MPGGKGLTCRDIVLGTDRCRWGLKGLGGVGVSRVNEVKPNCYIVAGIF